MSLGLREQRGPAIRNAFSKAAQHDYGTWFIYRRYHLNEPAAQEALTGEGLARTERWKFTDEPILARQEATGITGTKGLITDQSIFYLDLNIRPKRGDTVVNVSLANKPAHLITPNEVLRASHVEAFRIVEIDTKRAGHGMVSHFACIVDPELGSY